MVPSHLCAGCQHCIGVLQVVRVHGAGKAGQADVDGRQLRHWHVWVRLRGLQVEIIIHCRAVIAASQVANVH